MSKKFLLPSSLLCCSILCSCGTPQKDSCGDNGCLNIDVESLDPLEAYKFFNGIFSSEEGFGFKVESEGKIISKRGYSQSIKEIKAKRDNEYFSKKDVVSDIYPTSSIKRYINNEDNTYAISESSDKNNDIFTNYSNYSFLNEEEYFKNYGSFINEITDFIVNPDAVDKSFLSYEKIDSSSSIIYNYDVSLSNVIKGDADLSEENYEDNIDNYEYINAAYYEEKEILNFFPIFEEIHIDEANLSITYFKENDNDSLNNNIKFNIEINEKLRINTIEFDYSLISTFDLIKNEEYPTNYKDLIDEISKSVEVSKGVMKDELYALYVDINNKYKAMNYYTYTESSVNALGGIYNQTVKGFKIKNNNEYFFQTVTTSAFVKKAELRYENSELNSYKIASGNDPDTSVNYGKVSSWNKWENYSYEDYISTLGHTMENVTNYIVDDEEYQKSFLDAYINENHEEKIITYKMSINETETHIDSIKDYKVEMNHMSGMGEPSFDYSEFDLYLDKETNNINRIVQKEKYSTGGFSCEAVMTTYFEIYDDIITLPKEIYQTYNNEVLN